ncbi:MAG: four helix bundle protein [Arcicella sp.]|jgi:four helix bundle protein|nr:four helix bundle protein [Arcicella sp.]
MQKKGILEEKTLSFSIRIVNLYKFLIDDKKEFVMSKQILRCGTNPGAMVREATNAESGLDFIHKLSIAQKEIAETIYWLELLQATNFLKQAEFESISSDAQEIMRIIRSSILTKKQNLNK